MANEANPRAILSTLVLLCAVFMGCDRPQSSQPAVERVRSEVISQQVVNRVWSEVATILGKDTNQIDVTRPLVTFGADELDVVEIVMALEEAFKVTIPDSAFAEKPDDIKTLTVQMLAEIVSRQQKSK